MAAPGSVESLRIALDRDGCAYGQVTRERIDNIVARMTAMENKLNFLLAGTLLQLLGFVFGVLLLVLGHLRVT